MDGGIFIKLRLPEVERVNTLCRVYSSVVPFDISMRSRQAYRMCALLLKTYSSGTTGSVQCTPCVNVCVESCGEWVKVVRIS